MGHRFPQLPALCCTRTLYFVIDSSYDTVLPLYLLSTVEQKELEPKQSTHQLNPCGVRPEDHNARFGISPRKVLCFG